MNVIHCIHSLLNYNDSLIDRFSIIVIDKYSPLSIVIDLEEKTELLTANYNPLEYCY